MPRVSPHLVKSAIRLVRQSTTVPKTSNTSAFTAEISDMTTPLLLLFLIERTRSKHLAILDETEIFRDLIVEDAGLRIGGVRQPVHPTGAGGFGPLVDRLDQRPAEAVTTPALADKQILQIAVIARRPGRAVKQILHNAGELAVDVAAEQEHRLVG